MKEFMGFELPLVEQKACSVNFCRIFIFSSLLILELAGSDLT